MDVLMLADVSGHPYFTNLCSHLEKDGIKVHRTGYSIPNQIKQLILLRNRVDAVNIHFTKFIFLPYHVLVVPLFPVLPLLLLWMRLKNRKIIWTVHNIVPHDCFSPRLCMFFNRLLCLVCTSVVAHTNASKAKIAETYGLPPQKIHVIPHGNFIPQVEEAKSGKSQRKDGGKKLIMFGSVRRYKNHLFALDAFKNAGCKDVSLNIVGEPVDRGISQSLAEKAAEDEKVSYEPGLLGHEVLARKICEHDGVLLSYKSITTSGALLLAMSAKKPVIAPAFEELVETAGDGGVFWYEPNDKRSLQKALKRFSQTSYSDLLEMGVRNLEVAKRYGWVDIVRKYKHLFTR